MDLLQVLALLAFTSLLGGASGQLAPAADIKITVSPPPATVVLSNSGTTTMALTAAASPPPPSSCATGCKTSCSGSQCLVKRSECLLTVCNTCMSNTCHTASGNPCPSGTCGVADTSNVCYPRLQELGLTCQKCVTAPSPCYTDVWKCPGAAGSQYVVSSVTNPCGSAAAGTGQCVTCAACPTSYQGLMCYRSQPGCPTGTVATKVLSFVITYYPCGECWQCVPTSG